MEKPDQDEGIEVKMEKPDQDEGIEVDHILEDIKENLMLGMSKSRNKTSVEQPHSEGCPQQTSQLAERNISEITDVKSRPISTESGYDSKHASAEITDFESAAQQMIQIDPATAAAGKATQENRKAGKAAKDNHQENRSLMRSMKEMTLKNETIQELQFKDEIWLVKSITDDSEEKTPANFASPGKPRASGIGECEENKYGGKQKEDEKRDSETENSTRAEEGQQTCPFCSKTGGQVTIHNYNNVQIHNISQCEQVHIGNSTHQYIGRKQKKGYRNPYMTM